MGHHRKVRMSNTIDPLDIVLCNCAECGREVYGTSMAPHLTPKDKAWNMVAGRINGRPYCNKCLAVKTILYRPGVKEPNPSQENAVRQLEDTRDGC